MNIVVSLLVGLMFFPAMAQDKLSTKEGVERFKDNKRSSLVEQTQLQRAKAAIAERDSREQKRLEHVRGERQARETHKAREAVASRETREQKYLREAKEAAQQERKIPKAKSSD